MNPKTSKIIGTKSMCVIWNTATRALKNQFTTLNHVHCAFCWLSAANWLWTTHRMNETRS